jgi:hypothetical protein
MKLPHAFWLAAAVLGIQEKPVLGYDDSPFLPDGTWRVHDSKRPAPPVVTPGNAPGEFAAPPSDAVVLFDGRSLSAWTSGDGGPAGWKVEDGTFEVAGGKGDVRTRESFGDVQLHLEFRMPPAEGTSQHRGNSGVFLMGRYEIQVLDSFENPTYADGQCAALYGQYPPLVNACRKPGEWQSYDIVFRAPRFTGETLARPAFVTVIHNGVLVHDRAEILGETAHRALPKYSAHAGTAPLRLQDHGNPVQYRNVWARRLLGAD